MGESYYNILTVYAIPQFYLLSRFPIGIWKSDSLVISLSAENSADTLLNSLLV